MELLQLQYFYQIAREQNISRAAEALHIAQPSLSQTLKRLEGELGVPLFDRCGKRIVLNSYGKIFLKYVEKILNALESASLELQAAQGRDVRSVRLCVQSASMLLPELYRCIREREKDISLYIFQNPREHVPGAQELILSSSWEPPEEEGSWQLLLEERILLALPAGHPLREKETLLLQDLEGEDFLSLSESSFLTKILYHYFAQKQFQPQVTTYMENPDILWKLLNARAGLAFIPEITWRPAMPKEILLRPVQDLPMKRVLLLSWKPDSYLPPAVQGCREAIAGYFTRILRQSTPSAEAWQC